jgi:ADP-ribose pyrophosphatase YjhB (NUDIX family)
MLKRAVRRIWNLLSPGMRAKLVRSAHPLFTVSAAAIITNDEGKVLLLSHVLRPGPGWGYPGGFAEKGEQAEDAVRREVREETGIELDDLQLLHVRTTGSHIEVLFSARAVGDPEVRSREIIELGWFGVEELPKEMSQQQQDRIRKSLIGR